MINGRGIRRLAIQTDRAEESWADEWFVIDQFRDRVSFGHEYKHPETGERKKWQDSGSSFAIEHIDLVIEALQAIRADVLESTQLHGQDPEKGKSQ
jgi:hypothetical protein